MHKNSLEVEITTGSHKGQITFIHRINLTMVESKEGHEKFTRRQFTVTLAVAMTINNSQKQTFSRVGLNFLEPVFGHGQLYVVLFRVRSSNSIYILLAFSFADSFGANSLAIFFYNLLMYVMSIFSN